MKISAIIPAHNEEKTISSVIDVLLNVKIIDEIIVVDDASTDTTSSIVKKYENVKLINLSKNLGKGGAVMEGVRNSAGEIILLLDADLIGLKEKHIYDLIYPVLNGEADMTRGYFADGRKYTDLSHKIAPSISGQRAIRRWIMEAIEDLEKTRFGIEVALNRYIKKNNLRLKKIKLSGVTHLTKEEKMGFKKGVKARTKMYWDILKYLSKLQK